jgi:glycine cleavage system aminomethyltransferase T
MTAAPTTAAPMAPPSSAAPLRRSALHHRLLAAGARMRAHRGWEQAVSLGDEAEERRAARTGVVLADVSAQHLLLAESDYLAAWLPFAPELGRVARFGDPVGGARCCRLTLDSALVLSADPAELPVPAPACGHQTVLTGGRTIVAIAGPRSRDLLAGATQVDLRDRALPDGACAQTSVARVPATILRADRGGIRAYEILAPRDYGEYLWEALLDAGMPLDVRAVGVAALEDAG